MKKYVIFSLCGALILLFGAISPALAASANYHSYTTCSGSSCAPECHDPACHATTTTTSCRSVAVHIYASPSSTDYNGSTVLSWNSSNASYCTASATPGNSQWSGNVSRNGSKTIYNLTGNTTFRIQCYNNCDSANDSVAVNVQTVEQFDFNLSNSGNIVVTKPNYGNTSASNVIYANLVAGNAQSVSFSQSGLPSGVNTSSISSCYPSCSKTNSLTINSSAPVGTFPITVTATGGSITRTTTYNLIIQDNYQSSLSVSCYASPSSIQTNQTTTFYSNVSGGTGNYSYYWSGAAAGSNSYSQRSFGSNGTYTAYLTVYDSQNGSANTSCSVYVSGQSYNNAPTLSLWADDYTLSQGESTYLRWTSNNANYCVASNGWSGSKSTNGYERVSPSYDTTYSLTCYGNGGQVSQSVTIYVTSSSTNLSLNKLGRNLSSGQRVYSNVIQVTEGDVVEFYITVTAGSDKDLYNVRIKDIMPAVLSYIPGTTKVDGVTQGDTITTSGLSLGTIYRNSSKTVVLQASSAAAGSYLTYTNTAEITADNESTITDSASITYGLVAGAATIRTGPADTLLISLMVSLALSALLWYLLKFNPKGKLAAVKIESGIRNMRLAYARRRASH